MDAYGKKYTNGMPGRDWDVLSVEFNAKNIAEMEQDAIDMFNYLAENPQREEESWLFKYGGKILGLQGEKSTQEFDYFQNRMTSSGSMILVYSAAFVTVVKCNSAKRYATGGRYEEFKIRDLFYRLGRAQNKKQNDLILALMRYAPKVQGMNLYGLEDYLMEGYNEEESDEEGYSVFLLVAGDQKIKLIQMVRNETGLGLGEAKELVESASYESPALIASCLDYEIAMMLKEEMESTGAVISIMADEKQEGDLGNFADDEEESDEEGYFVLLLETGTQKNKLIKAIRDYAEISMAEAKNLAESASKTSPSTIVSAVSYEYAEEIKETLEGFGAVVKILSDEMADSETGLSQDIINNEVETEAEDVTEDEDIWQQEKSGDIYGIKDNSYVTAEELEDKSLLSPEDEKKSLDVQRAFERQSKNYCPDKIRNIQDRSANSYFSDEVRNISLDVSKFASEKKNFVRNKETEKKAFESSRSKYEEAYEAKEEEKERKAQKKKAKRRKTSSGCFTFLILIVLLAAVGHFIVWPNMIYPRLEAESYYTPEIIKTYSGAYETGTTEGEGILTFISCNESGNLKGTFEFIVENSIYGKYEITGRITDKRNNGNLVLTVSSGAWLVQPEDFVALEEMNVEILNNYRIFECSRYGMYWSEGENDEYSIKMPSDLDKLRNSSSVYYLKNDIDLSGKDWTPIDGFTGTLVGNGYTIKNMKISASENNVGFFSTLNGVVNNLHFENAEIDVTGKKENIGILCGKMESGTIINISVSGSVEAVSSQNVGGVVGYVKVFGSYSIDSVKNEANVLGSQNVGGVFGKYENTADNYNNYTMTLSGFENTGIVKAVGESAGGCIGYLYTNNATGYSILVQASEFKNSGDVSGQAYVGGIVGYAYSDATESYITDCSSSGKITAKYLVGGIVGRARNIMLLSCENAGGSVTATEYLTEDGKKYAYVGGIAGYGFLIGDSTNTVSIKYTGEGKYVGGIAGYASVNSSFTMSGLKNVADISGAEAVGGIFGGFESIVDSYDNYTAIMQKFENDGTIMASGNCVGGVIGYLYAENEIGTYGMELQMSDFKSSGSVSGEAYVGGVLGYAYSDRNSSLAQDFDSSTTISAEYMVGGIAGQMSNISMQNCSNVGTTITATGYYTEEGERYAYIGGFAGYGYLASDCVNVVEIKYTAGGKYVGGIIGYSAGAGDGNSIKNLTNEAQISGNDYLGGIIGCCDVIGEYTMDNLKNEAEISGDEFIGGILGCVRDEMYMYSNHKLELRNFENSGAISGQSYVGGTIGYYYAANTGSYSIVVHASDMKNIGDVRGETWIGGIYGYAYSDSTSSTLTDCSSSGAIVADYLAGGIAGQLENISLLSGDNTGTTISANGYLSKDGIKYAYVGGYVGYGYLVSDCTNTVGIDYDGGGRYIGGIMGYSDASVEYTMSDLKNEADISGKEYVGGIIGGLENYLSDYSNFSVTLKNFENTGTIKVTNSYAGGTIAYFTAESSGSYKATVYISDFKNSGKVSGKTYIGGVLGYAESDSTESKMTGTVATGSVSGKTPYGKVKGKVENITVVTD